MLDNTAQPHFSTANPTWQLILDASPVGILLCTGDGSVIEANALAEALFGRSLNATDHPTLGTFIACAHCHPPSSNCCDIDKCPACVLAQAIRCTLEEESNAFKKEGEVLLERAFDMPAIWLKYRATHIVLDGRKLTILAIEDITKQKIAERNEQHAQNLMRYIIEHANSAIAVHDKDLRYLHVSRRYLEAYGVEEKNILGRHHYEVFPDLPQKWREVHQKALAGETSRAEADPFVRADGSVDWTRWECRPWFAADGTIGGIIVYTEVINEERRVAKQLEEDEHYLRTILQTTADGFWVLDAEGYFLEANTAFLRMSGYTLEELTRMHISDLDADETPDDTRKHIQHIVANGSDMFQARHRRKDGRLFDVEVSVTYLAKKGGRFICFARDIGERKSIEAALRESEKKYRRIAENSADVVWTMDLNLRTTYVSPSVLRLLGETVEEHLAKALTDRLTPESLDRVYAIFKEELENEQYPEVDKSRTRVIEIEHYRADGTTVWTSANVSFLRTPDGDIIGIQGVSRDITERRRHEIALKESENELRESQKIARLGRWKLDLDTQQLQWSETIHELFETDPDTFEASYAAFLAFVHPEDRETVDQTFRSAVAQQKPYEIEHRLLMRDGRTKWVNEIGRIEHDERGRPRRAIGTTQDITERKQAELQLIENHKLLHNLTEMVPGVVYQYRLFPDGRSMFPYASSGMRLIYEYAPEAVREDASPVFGRLHPDDHDRVAEAIFESARTLALFQCQFRVLLPRQGLRWRWSQAQPQRMEDGSTLWHGIISDITERKKMEEKVRNSETQFRSLVTNAPDAIYVENNTGRILYANEAALRLFGATSPDQLYGTSTDERFHPDSQGAMREHLRRLHKGKRNIPRHEAVCMRRDGSTVVVELSAVPLIYEEQACALTFLQDVSARKQLEARLRQAQKMEAIGSLAGGIAHDFNNILFPIIGLSEMLLDDLPAGSRERGNVASIHQAGQRAKELVNQILSFSRQMETRKTPVRFQQVLKEVLKLVHATIPSNITIRYNLQNDCGPLLADPTNLHQIAMNLITNAYHAVEHNSGSIAIDLRQIVCDRDDADTMALPPGAYARLTVSDTGHGIPAHVRPKIFDPYFTTKPQGKGTGMGLAVCYGIVQEHGGDIRVYSEIDQGTTFKVFLPILTCNPDVQQPAETTVHPTGTERILLVDDEAPILRLEKQILERLGYRVQTRTGSIDALAHFKSDPFAYDLVITDMAMPNMTGEQLARHIIAVRPGMPLILCTGFSENMSAAKAQHAGFRDFLMKPVSRGDLARKVRDVLDAAAEKTP